MNRQLLSNAVTAVFALCAVAVASAAVKQQFFAQQANAAVTVSAPRNVKDWARLAEAGQRVGPATAPVTIIEFSDFECPFCALLHQTLRSVQARNPDAVTLVYRHFPLQGHKHAFAAAVASECSGAQGKFAAFHDLLFQQQDSIGVRSWASFATAAGVADQARFEECMQSDVPRARVEADRSAAKRLGLSGTPTIIVNGKLVSGIVTIAELEELAGRSLQ